MNSKEGPQKHGFTVMLNQKNIEIKDTYRQ